MGIGSPGLRTVCAACALPLTVAACLIGAPAALADSVVATPEQAAAVVATGAGTVSGATSGLASATSAPAANARTVAATASDTVAQTTQPVTLSAPTGATNAASVKTAELVAAPHRSHSLARAVARTLRTAEPLVRVKPVLAAQHRAHAQRSPSVVSPTIFDSAPVVDAGTALGGGTAGIGLLLLGLLAFAALTLPPDAFRRRIAPGARALRPSSLLLRLERPD